jgi:pimeloyl-ACP methyl ester carboxylesterase
MTGYQHRTIVAGDIRTHFLEAGSGPDLVLLHGGEYGASAEITWRANIEALAKRFHVIAPDILGWGQTDKVYSFSDPAGMRIKHLQRFFEPWVSVKPISSATRPAAASSSAPSCASRRCFKSRKW